MSEYTIAARYVGPRKGYLGGWTGIVLRDGREVSHSYAHDSEQDALRAADGYRDGWLGKARLTGLVAVNGLMRDERDLDDDFGRLAESYGVDRL